MLWKKRSLLWANLQTLIDLTENKKGRHYICQKNYGAAVFEAKELRQKTSNSRHLLIRNKGA